MLTYTRFSFCPLCASERITEYMRNGMRCTNCGYTYFHNAAAAVAGIIECDGTILLTRRNHEPRKGFWDLPGGFVDYNETAEAALKREIFEELHCAIENCRYMCSFPNIYRYASVDYFTCDMVFICNLQSEAIIRPNSEIMETMHITKTDIDWDSLAFSSTQAALKYYDAQSA